MGERIMKTTKCDARIKVLLGAIGCAGLPACTYVEAPPGVTEDGGDGDAWPSGDDDADDGGDESTTDDGGVPADCVEVEIEALGVLQTYCAGCHQPGPNPPGGFDFVTDAERLVEEGKIVPGDSAASPLFGRVESKQMPPAAAAAFPTDEEIWTLQQWIDECVPGGGAAACEPDHRIGIDGMLAAINADISNPNEVAQESRPFVRYLTLSQLYDQGLCGEELAVYRRALAKTINSLSNGTSIVVPKAIDADETIYRIDLRDYEWDAALWRELVDLSPYAFELTREEAIDLQQFTGEDVPILRGDWLAAEGTAPPIYQIMLGIDGATLFDLQQQLQVNIQANIGDEIVNNTDNVVRAGFLDSGVSENNRVIERHEIPGAANRALWISYDFAGNAEAENIFATPVGFIEAGSELIFSLPNGLHAYMIVDNAGTQLDEAPDNIVTDPSQPTGNVIEGRSCFGCHSSGMNFVTDELLEHVTSSLEFGDDVKQAVENLHPEAAELQAILQSDADVYAAALAQTGADVGAEPIGAVFEWYEQSVDLTMASAELGVTEDELLIRLGGLAPDLQPLAYGTIKRDAFEQNYAQAVCDLQLGITPACASE
jgi:mono/diheme cytochrome c family protein